MSESVPADGRPEGIAGSGSTCPRLTLYSKPGCHLCEVARAVLQRISGETGAGLAEVNILDDPALIDEYAEMIPVILLDGRMHGYYRVEEERLRRDLAT